MKNIFVTTSLLFVPISQVFAHEEGSEITNLAEADWIGPLIAIVIIAGAIILARIIRKRSARPVGGSGRQKSEIINNNPINL